MTWFDLIIPNQKRGITSEKPVIPPHKNAVFWDYDTDKSRLKSIWTVNDLMQWVENPIASSSISDAADVTYTPTTPGDWVVPPDDVGEALDELADSVTILDTVLTALAGDAVLSVTAADPLSSTGGANPNITHDDSGAVADTYMYPSLTIDAKGHISAAESLPVPDCVEGRLTLESDAPVSYFDQTGSLVYYTPYEGNHIKLYDGTNWLIRQFTELSVAVPSLDAQLFDVFIYDDNGTPTLETENWNATGGAAITSISNASPPVALTANPPVTGQIVVISGNTDADNNGVWRVGTTVAFTSFQLKNLDGSNPAAPGSVGTGGAWIDYGSNAARATDLVRQDGVLVKSGDATRRYLGTGRTIEAGDCEDSYTKRLLWNYYHRKERGLVRVESTDTWTYGTDAWRVTRDDFANRVALVIGVAEDVVAIDVLGMITGAASVAASVSLDDSLFPSISSQANVFSELSITAGRGILTALYRKLPVAGFHDYYWIERARGGVSTTFIGDAGFTTQQTGIVGKFLG